MAKYKKRERLKKPSVADERKPVPAPSEDGAVPAGYAEETVTGMQQLYGNRVVQRLAGDSNPVELDGQTASRINTSRGRGNPLDPKMMQAMGNTFSHDFNGVRVHDDSEANELANQLHARAFTVGQDIYVKSDALDPHTGQGINTLSHELAHVVQQSEASGNANQLVNRPDLEQEAEGATVNAGSRLDTVAVQKLDEEPRLSEVHLTGFTTQEVPEPGNSGTTFDAEDVNTLIRDYIRDIVGAEGEETEAPRINLVNDDEFNTAYGRECYPQWQRRTAGQFATGTESLQAFMETANHTGGFATPGGEIWIRISSESTIGTIIHEALHVYSRGDEMLELIGSPGVEGMTEFVAREILRGMGYSRVETQYERYFHSIELLVDCVGLDTVRCYFFTHNNWEFKHAIDERRGVRRAGELWCWAMSAGHLDRANSYLGREFTAEQLEREIERTLGAPEAPPAH
jgi:hypothetical protein